MVPGFGTLFRPATATSLTTFDTDGFVSIRLISAQTGRIEADPTGEFGGDVFVVSRGRNPTLAGLLSGVPFDPTDQPGRIYRVDPYAVNAFGTPPFLNRRPFALMPVDPIDPFCSGGNAGEGGYCNWFDLSFDPTAAFRSANGKPRLFVSSLNAIGTGFDPRNAIYAFLPDGTPVVNPPPSDPESQSYAFSDDIDVSTGHHDTQLGVLAVAPGDTFGRALYTLDVSCNNPPGDTCVTGDGNAIFRILPEQMPPIDLDSATASKLNPHVESVLPPLVIPGIAQALIDNIKPRALVFDPNRGIIFQGQFGEPAFQYFGGMYVASSTFDSSPAGLGPGVSRILQFPSLGSPVLDLIPPVSVRTLLIGDMAFDPIGHFGGGIFYTDYITGSVHHVLQNPVTGVVSDTPFATGFNVITPTHFADTDPPGPTPEDSYLDAFSITFSPNGEVMYVSDRDGIWGFFAGTIAQSAPGAVSGVTDLRELRVPYTGEGYAAAVIDSGVDGAHLGFRNTVAAGFGPAFPAPGIFDLDADPPPAHGTAVAGVIHQVAPDAVLVPVRTLGQAFTTQDLYNSIRYVRDNPLVEDPRTPGLRVPIVAANMAVQLRDATDPAVNQKNEREAFDSDRSAVIALKTQFESYLKLGIVPVGAAGNQGDRVNGMKSMSIPAVLNEVVSAIASYPYGPTPPLPAPPVTVPDRTGTATRCLPEPGDLTIFPGKIVGNSNRSLTSDFAAPGTCVTTYSPSLLLNSRDPAVQALGIGPLSSGFNGTSAASGFVTGSFLLGFDIIERWSAVAAAGGLIDPASTNAKIRELHEYLIRDLAADLTKKSDRDILSFILDLGRVLPKFATYLNINGINSILQWTAIPREDVNIGEALIRPNGTDDAVAPLRLLGGVRYRTYSHLHVGNFLSAVEGIVSLKYFLAHPDQLTLLDTAAGTPGLITANDIDCMVGINDLISLSGNRILENGAICSRTDPATYNLTTRAMARLLGGGDRIARTNRLTFLDLAQNERQDGGIITSRIKSLANRLLPSPQAFIITNRFASARRHFAIDSTALRNYHDLVFRPRSSILAPHVDGDFRNLSPDELRLGRHGTFTSFSPLGTRTDLSSSELEGLDSGSAADISASSAYRSVYTEVMDRAIAGIRLGDKWDHRAIDPGSTMPGAGSIATDLLTDLGVGAREDPS